MIKAVFFDLYGTLAGFSPSRYEIQSAACGQFGIELTEQGTLRGYGEADAFMTRQNATFPLRDMDEDEIYEQTWASDIYSGADNEDDLLGWFYPIHFAPLYLFLHKLAN